MVRELLTVSEVAALARVHQNTVYRWLNKGSGGERLRSVKRGGLHRIPRSEVERFFALDDQDVASPNDDATATAVALDSLGV